MPKLDGSTHINLTVVDLDRSTEWYTRVFGFVVVNDVAPPDYDFRFRTLVHPGSFASVVLGVPTGAAAVDTSAATAPVNGAGPPAEPPVGDRFDEHRVGLHHLGYHVPERDDLDAWVRHLDEVGVAHSGITVSQHEAGAQVWLRDPDNIWVEVYWVNRAFFADRLRRRWREARRAGRTDWTAATVPAVER